MKWLGLYVVTVFGIFVFIRELSARWVAEPYRTSSSILTGGIPASLNLVPITAVVYVGSWPGRFLNPNGWRHAGGSGWRDWLEHHCQVLNFHTILVLDHPCKASPWRQLLQLRPTSLYYQKVAGNCGKDQCTQTVISLNDPLLWWFGALTLVVVIMGNLVFLDWRAGLILAGHFATFGPWMIYPNRTISTSYTVVISPFMVSAVIYTLGVMMGRRRTCSDKNQANRHNLAPHSFPVNQIQTYLGLFIVALIFLVVVYFFSIWTGATMPQHQFYWWM